MKIAIVGSKFQNSYGIGIHYYHLIDYLGGSPVILTANSSDSEMKKLAESVDLLILPGGADLSAHLYGRKPHIFNSGPDVHKEHFFIKHLSKFIEAKTPVFGICLGFQMLNVHFGGTLTQHISGLHQDDKRGVAAHEVWDIEKKGVLDVNSHHHQAVKYANLADGLTPLTLSSEYDKKIIHNSLKIERNIIIESFIHESLPVAGVQWHPEEWYDEHSIGLIQKIMR